MVKLAVLPLLVSQAVPPPQLSELSTAWTLSDCMTVCQDNCPLGQLTAFAAGTEVRAENPQELMKRMSTKTDTMYGIGLGTRTMFPFQRRDTRYRP